MAFFGLTALGPQNCFSSAALQTRNLHIFDDEDFRNAWVKIVGSTSKFAETDQLGDIMRALFRGPIPPSDQYEIELALNNNISNLESPEIIGYHMYMDIMIRLRYEAEIEDKKLKSRHRAAESCEFDSSLKYQESLTKHSRMKAGMNTKQTQPLTSSQEVGWEKQELSRPIAGRSDSEITKYAAELIKNGVFY